MKITELDLDQFDDGTIKAWILGALKMKRKLKNTLSLTFAYF